MGGNFVKTLNKTPSEIQTEKEERILSRGVNKAIREQHERELKVTKILLLGTGESGKTTILKQARRYYGHGYSDQDFIEAKQSIYRNVIEEMQKLIKFRRRNYDSKENDSEALVANEEIIIAAGSDWSSPKFFISKTLAEAIRAVWADEVIQTVWEQRNEFQVYDSLEYFCQDSVLTRMSESESNFVPSFDDFLQVRIITNGISHEKFKVKGRIFELYDLGGQKSERRKWIDVFNNVTAVMYVIAISEFDQMCYENQNLNRIVDALAVWKKIISRDDFRHVGFVIFFNKFDLFVKKLQSHYFRDEATGRFLDFKGVEPCTLESDSPEQFVAIENCFQFIRNEFLKLCNPKERTGIIKTEKTVATDCNSMEKAFKVATDTLLNNIVVEGGFVTPI